LAAQARQASLKPAVSVGGPILEFVLPDDAGRAFDLSSLRGRAFLLKFFRGHW
jgi:peroxiredoxin